MAYNVGMEFKEFVHPYVTVDVLVFSIVEGKLAILLMKRDTAPFEGIWALPGGFVKTDESLDGAANRIVVEKGGLKDVFLEQLFSFGGPERDPRAWVISVSYFALVPEAGAINIESSQVIKWFPVEKLPEMAFDHKEIINTGMARLKAKISYSNIAVGILPRHFRLSELQRVYEIILSQPLDKRNFRKKMLSLDLLKAVGKTDKGEKRRPAMLYTFKTSKTVFFD